MKPVIIGNATLKETPSPVVPTINYCFQCRFFNPYDHHVDQFDHTDHDLVLEWSNQPENEEFIYCCRRYPPVYAGKERNYEHNIKHPFFEYPEINWFDWCGEFQPRPCYAANPHGL